MNSTLTRLGDRLFDDLYTDQSDKRLFRMMSELADSKWKFAVFGGYVRDLHLFEGLVKSRDIDIVVDGPSTDELRSWLSVLGFKTVINSYGGIKTRSESMAIDIWPIEITWAMREGYVKPSLANLPACTFLNLDSIAAEFRRTSFVIHERCYLSGIERRLLDINQVNTPNVVYVVGKTLLLAARLDFSISNRLSHYICEAYDHLGKALIKDVIADHRKRASQAFLNEEIALAWLRLFRIACTGECDGVKLPLPRSMKGEDNIAGKVLRDERRIVKRNLRSNFSAY